MSDTRFIVKHSFTDVLKVLENIEEISQFTLKAFGSLTTLKKDSHQTFDILAQDQNKEKPVRCGSLELIGTGDHKTEIKFSQDFAKGKTPNNTGLDRFFYLLIQQFVQRGMKTFDE